VVFLRKIPYLTFLQATIFPVVGYVVTIRNIFVYCKLAVSQHKSERSAATFRLAN